MGSQPPSLCGQVVAVCTNPLRGQRKPQKERGFNMDYEGYCVKCREKRQVKDGKVVETSTGRPMAKGTCPVCGTTVTRFLSNKEAGK